LPADVDSPQIGSTSSRNVAHTRKDTTMRFLMLVLTDPTLEEAEGESPTHEPPITIEAWVEETYGSGRAVEGDRLRPASDAKTVRRRKGEVIVSDGPFAEAYELIGGFDLLECDSLEEAVEIASRHPMASAGVIQLHPAWPLDL
jgi:hypothetical protein